MSYIYYAKDKNLLKTLLRYKAKFKNYLTVVIMYKRGRYPIHAVLRNGNSVVLNNHNEVCSAVMGLDYDSSNDIVTLHHMNGLKILGGINNGELIGIFYDRQFDFLPVKDKVVIDIGANIGDSAIYFMYKGATKVIALEPYPKNYEIANRNVELNNLSNKIELLLAGCSNHSGYILVDENIGSPLTSLQKSQRGKKIPILTLSDILDTYGLKSTVLKMDCEGCEYDAILSSTSDTLKQFGHIQVEYHYGYRDLKDKLEMCDFKVSITKPKYFPNRQAAIQKMYVGWLYAHLQ